MERSHATSRRTGFTLIEIMAVVLIMGLLMSVVGYQIFQRVDQARVTTAKAKMKSLESALEFYRMDNARYPTTEQGLEALLRAPGSAPQPRNYPPGGYLKTRDAIVDPWGTQYQYESPGQHNPYSFDLWSLGADGTAGGDGVDADLGNWDEEEFASG